MSELRPCPFCTSSAVEVEEVVDRDGNIKSAQVTCDACGAWGPFEATVEKAVEFWNGAIRLLPGSTYKETYHED